MDSVASSNSNRSYIVIKKAGLPDVRIDTQFHFSSVIEPKKPLLVLERMWSDEFNKLLRTLREYSHHDYLYPLEEDKIVVFNYCWFVDVFWSYDRNPLRSKQLIVVYGRKLFDYHSYQDRMKAAFIKDVDLESLNDMMACMQTEMSIADSINFRVQHNFNAEDYF